MALRWSAVRIIGGHVEGGPITTEIHARNIDVDRLVTETDLESALLGLPRAGIGHICGIVEVFESSVRLLCKPAGQLRNGEPKPRSSRMVEVSRLTISFVNYPFVLCGVPVALLFTNQFHHPVGQFFPKQVLGGYRNRCVLTRQIVGAIRLGCDCKVREIVAVDANVRHLLGAAGSISVWARYSGLLRSEFCCVGQFPVDGGNSEVVCFCRAAKHGIRLWIDELKLSVFVCDGVLVHTEHNCACM